MILVWKLLVSLLSQVSCKWVNSFRSLERNGRDKHKQHGDVAKYFISEKETTLKYNISKGIFLYSRSG
jgi:hypothetical protein